MLIYSGDCLYISSIDWNPYISILISGVLFYTTEGLEFSDKGLPLGVGGFPEGVGEYVVSSK